MNKGDIILLVIGLFIFGVSIVFLSSSSASDYVVKHLNVSSPFVLNLSIVGVIVGFLIMGWVYSITKMPKNTIKKPKAQQDSFEGYKSRYSIND
jgi:hypothetical protein